MIEVSRKSGHGNALLSLLFWVTNPLLSGRSGVRVTSRTRVKDREQFNAVPGFSINDSIAEKRFYH